MTRVMMAVLAAVLLASAFGCRDDRDDETSRGEKQERIDTTRGRTPTN